MGIVEQFVKLKNGIITNQLAVEGIILLDEKRIIREYHFTDDKPRNIYSHTKSYVSLAIGIAIDRGYISLNERLIDCFPEHINDSSDDALAKITLRDLLMMASGFNKPYLMGADRRAGIGFPDYVSYMLQQKILTQPGTRFVYSSADSILAVKMLEKKLDSSFGSFVYESIFQKLKQGWPIWEHDFNGTPVGCGGIALKLSDMVKLGQVYLNDGYYAKEQIVSKNWIDQSSAKQIETDDKKDIWHCGYGFQFWRCPYGDSFRADGKYGQLTIVLKDKGVVFGIQCPENGDFSKVKKFLHEEFLMQI